MPPTNARTDRLNLLQRIWYSIFPGTYQKSLDRQGYRNLFNTLLLHFRPRQDPERTLKFTLTWGLGGMAAVLVLNQFATGALLKFAYQPTVGSAYLSIVALQNELLFGRLIRN